MSQLVDFDPAFTVDLPESGTEQETVIPSSSVYVSEKFSGCDKEFALSMTDGSEIPPELSLDSDSGVLELETVFTRKTSYDISITITQYGGNQPDVTTIAGITIDIVCGPNSAILQPPPEYAPLVKGNIYDEPALSFTSKFRTSNDLCPVVDYELTAGSD